MELNFFDLKIADKVAQLTMNRPEKANALDEGAWWEMERVFNHLDQTPEVRAIILKGNGKHFCAGIDISLLMGLEKPVSSSDIGRQREGLRKLVLKLQATINAIENCRKPVLAAIHGGCIGGGLDIVSACDMRYCTDDSYFTVKEVDVGLVADLGSLQRLPKIVSEGVAREMAFTGMKVPGTEAVKVGLANRSFADRETLYKEVENIAAQLASKSPLVIRGIKEVMNYSRDHSLADGLNYVATWNSAMILSNDLREAAMAAMQKRKPEFED